MQIDARSCVALLKKDIRLQWVAFLVLVAFELLTFASFEAQFPEGMRQSAGMFLQGVASIGTFVMAYRVLATEEASGAIQFLKTLPLTNDEIYSSKFIFMLGHTIANAAALNLIFLAALPLLPGDMSAPGWSTVLIGLVVQLVFAVILVSIATLATSEKAIWVPFPLVILVLNGYTLLVSDSDKVIGANLIRTFMQAWAWYSLGLVVLLVALSVTVVRLTRLKKALAG